MIKIATSLFLVASTALSQPPAAKAPAFDVVSIRPSKPGAIINWQITPDHIEKPSQN